MVGERKVADDVDVRKNEMGAEGAKKLARAGGVVVLANSLARSLPAKPSLELFLHLLLNLSSGHA